jgi:hypothetical protein
MTIFELQKLLTDDLNDIEALIQSGCKAFAEDTRTVYNESDQFVSSGGVALVVVTPRLTRTGGNTASGIPVEGDILVRCIERAPLAKNKATIRALDAAEIVAHSLDDDGVEFKSIDQSVSPHGDTITATVTFSCAFVLTPNERN